MVDSKTCGDEKDASTMQEMLAIPAPTTAGSVREARDAALAYEEA